MKAFATFTIVASLASKVAYAAPLAQDDAAAPVMTFESEKILKVGEFMELGSICKEWAIQHNDTVMTPECIDTKRRKPQTPYLRYLVTSVSAKGNCSTSWVAKVDGIHVYPQCSGHETAPPPPPDSETTPSNIPGLNMTIINKFETLLEEGMAEEGGRCDKWHIDYQEGPRKILSPVCDAYDHDLADPHYYTNHIILADGECPTRFVAKLTINDAGGKKNKYDAGQNVIPYCPATNEEADEIEAHYAHPPPSTTETCEGVDKLLHIKEELRTSAQSYKIVMCMLDPFNHGHHNPPWDDPKDVEPIRKVGKEGPKTPEETEEAKLSKEAQKAHKDKQIEETKEFNEETDAAKGKEKTGKEMKEEGKEMKKEGKEMEKEGKKMEKEGKKKHKDEEKDGGKQKRADTPTPTATNPPEPDHKANVAPEQVEALVAPLEQKVDSLTSELNDAQKKLKAYEALGQKKKMGKVEPHRKHDKTDADSEAEQKSDQSQRRPIVDGEQQATEKALPTVKNGVVSKSKKPEMTTTSKVQFPAEPTLGPTGFPARPTFSVA